MQLIDVAEQGRIIAKANDVLTPELGAKIGAVHGTYLGKNNILVAARDYNNNSRMLKRAYISGVMSAGINVLNLHSAPLPLVQFCIRRFGAAGGGVYFGSGHAYRGKTSIRFFDSSGIEYSKQNIDSLNTFFSDAKIKRVDPTRIGTISSILQTFEVYKKTLPQFINRKLVSSTELKVVMDCSYGPMGELAPEILNSINTNVIALNTYYRPLSNRLYPNIETVRDVSSIVKASEADIGIIFDSDGGRALILDETGNIVEYEDLFMLFISSEEGILKSKANPLITTESTSKILDEYSKTLGYKLIRTKSMPSAISRKLRGERGAFGASDSYTFYFPQYGPFSDGVFTLLKLLEILARKNEPLSSLIRNFPKTIKTSKTMAVSKDLLNNYHNKIYGAFSDDEHLLINSIIGNKIVFDEDSWVKVSPSIYRDALILTSEAPDSNTSQELISQVEETLTSDKTDENGK